MKINLNWLSEFVDWKTKVKDTDQLIKLLDARLGEIQVPVDLKAKYRNCVIVEIDKVEDHPDANLKVATINTGSSSKEVVCGDLSIKAGQQVVWLAPSENDQPTIVPNTFYEERQKKIEVLEIRGVKSYGMLASSAELDLDDNNDQILILNNPDLAPTPFCCHAPTIKVGASFRETFNLIEPVLELDNKIFANRPDCFGLISLCLEVAAILDVEFKLPEWWQLTDSQPKAEGNDKFKLAIEDPQKTFRLAGQLITGLTVKPSAIDMQIKLATVGLNPINNLVDASNLAMYLTAQPSHAFDYQKLREVTGQQVPTISTRSAREGETLTLLGDKSIKFSTEKGRSLPILICGNDQPLSLAGIKGGQSTEIDQTTESVFLEVANFKYSEIWRAGMSCGLTSDALTRFTKKQSPHQVDPVIKFVSKLLAQVGEGQIDGNYCQVYPNPTEVSKTVEADISLINERLELDLKPEEMANILTRIGCQVQILDSKLAVVPPFWRIDLNIAEDIVEEVGRIYGFENIVPKQPPRSTKITQPDKFLVLNKKIRQVLAKAGANESLSYSFISKKDILEANQSLGLAYSISNPLSPRLKYYRLSLTPSLLKATNENRKAGNKSFALFELGICHEIGAEVDENNVPTGLRRLSLVYSQDERQTTSNPFFSAKSYLELVAKNCHVNFSYRPFTDEIGSIEQPFLIQHSAQVLIDKEPIGIVGLLERNIAGFEIDIAKLEAISAKAGFVKYRPLSKFPTSSQDVTLRVDKKITFAEIEATLKGELRQLDDSYTELNPISIYQPKNSPNKKHLTWQLKITNFNKTLTTDQVSEVVAKLVEVAETKHQAEQV